MESHQSMFSLCEFPAVAEWRHLLIPLHCLMVLAQTLWAVMWRRTGARPVSRGHQLESPRVWLTWSAVMTMRRVAVQECLLPCITGLGRAESGPESSQQHRGLACAPVPGCVSRGCIHFRVLLCLSGAHWVLGPPDFSFNPSSETLLGVRDSLTFPEHLWPPAAALSSLAVTPWGGLTSACYRIGVGD